MLTPKMKRQETVSRISPPASGPITVEIPDHAVHVPIALPRSRSEKVAVMIPSVAGTSSAPVTPCSPRARISSVAVGAGGAQQRGDAEPHDPEREHALAPVDVPERAADQQQRAQREQVGVDDPLLVGEPDPEIGADLRQRHLDDGAVHEDDDGAEDARDQREALGLCRHCLEASLPPSSAWTAPSPSSSIPPPAAVARPSSCRRPRPSSGGSVFRCTARRPPASTTRRSWPAPPPRPARPCSRSAATGSSAPWPARCADTGTPLGVLPGGRGNDFARVLGIPATRPRRCARWSPRPSASSTSAEAGGRPFIGIASLRLRLGGQPHRQRVAGWLKGNLVYLYAALRALATWKPARFELVLDGEVRVYTGWSVGACNSKAYGGGMYAAPDAELDDGLLDVVVSERTSRFDFVCRLLPGCSRARTSTCPTCT